jgi:uncharacterized membrane protein YphA (DoxX/SURF4 family)
MDSVAAPVPDALSQISRDARWGAEESRWNIGTRIAFRFVCSYFLVYCFPQPAWYVAEYLSPWVSWPMSLYGRLFGWTDTMWNTPTLWVAAHVFHTMPSMADNGGSGDTAFDWLELVVCFAVAVVATLVWSVVDRKNRYDERIYPWFRLYIRMVLAMMILYYGASKIFPSQFYPIPLSRYMQPLAAGSPMGLLWSMMSASRLYTFFAGFVETLAAVLLFVPRFATLGGLVAAAAMTNIVMLNFGYDVPVKGESLHLLFMSMIIVGPDLGNLASLFLLNRSSKLYASAPFFRRPWFNRAGLIAQLACCALLVPGALLTQQADALSVVNPPYYGLWKVRDFHWQGKPRPPLTTDPVRWREVAFDHYDRFWVDPMEGLPALYSMSINAHATAVSLRAFSPDYGGSGNSPIGPTIGRFAIRSLSSDRMLLDGSLRGRSIEVTLYRVPLSSFLLVSRGFHWINEYPFNR